MGPVGRGFLGRVITYIATEFLVHSARNSRVFQRFSARASRSIDDLSRKVSQKKMLISEQLKDMQENLKNQK